MSEREALKPCPFCGGEASSDQTGPGEYDVSCFECTAGTIACGPRAEDRASAIAAWNTRALAMPDREAIADPWQPIETAPTNASVLVFIPNAEHYGQGVYRAMQVDMGTGRRWMTTGYAIGRDCPVECQPTHWQPLPDAPLALTVGGGLG